jgi:phosphocarrier protein HPr
MISEPITFINKFGLHTRAAAKLVALCSRFESKIQLRKNDQVADCKSIMNLILLGLTKNTTVDLLIVGADEREAREAIIQLIQNRFGEDE